MGRRLALLIGNSHFDDADNFRELRTPENDVNALANVLQNYGGFEIVGLIINQDNEAIKAGIEDFYNKANRGDLTLLYFSSHGFRPENGNLYLIAKNSRKDRLISSAVGENFIKEAVQTTKSHHRVMIFDCCFSGAFVTNSKSGQEQFGFDNLKGETDAILASSGKNQFSFEEEGDYSLFTKFLIEGIETGEADQNEDGWIEVEELFDFISHKVKQVRPEQTPLLSLKTRDSQIYIAKGIDLTLAKSLLICPSNPTNDYLTAWISAKLSLSGYKLMYANSISYDKTIVSRLKRDVRKVIFIVTGALLNNSPILELFSSIMEYSFNENFIIFLKFEDIDISKLPYYSSDIKTIDFSKNWADGLSQLNFLLQQDRTPNDNLVDSEKVLSQWKAQLAVRNEIQIDKNDNYLSNWFSLTVPDYIYLHGISSYDKTKADLNSVPLVFDKSYLITFSCENCCANFADIYKTEKVLTKEFFNKKEFMSSNSICFKDTNKKIIDLLNQAFYFFLKNRGLEEYRQSNSSIFYFSNDKSTQKRNEMTVKLDKLGRKSVQLSGIMKNYHWFFAIETNAFLYPIPAYFLSYHAVFKTPEGNLVEKELQHSLRRKLGKGWYNGELCALTYGAIYWLLGDKPMIYLPVDCIQNITVSQHPIMFTSHVSYLNPGWEKQSE